MSAASMTVESNRPPSEKKIETAKARVSEIFSKIPPVKVCFLKIYQRTGLP